jgi:YD repeat-containing protein
VRASGIERYDPLNRLTEISSVPASGPPIGFSYSYNAANQRTRMGLADGSYWVYQYDALGQVISGKKYWPDGTPVAGQQFEYAFDHIGNRTQTKAGGDAAGQGLRQASYSPNLLNQYTQRTVPGAFDVLGIANVAATVKVNNQDAYRRSRVCAQDAGNCSRMTRTAICSATGGGTTPGTRRTGW